MFESIKTKLWNLLKTKDVSLAMLYNREGEIIWHKGRPVKGKTIRGSSGFSKTYISRSIEHHQPVEEENVIVSANGHDLSASAIRLNIKSLIILPVNASYYLYIDSGIRESFSTADREIFRIMGDLLGELIEKLNLKMTDAGGITGQSEKILRIRELILKYSLEDEPILLLGETGSGKSHIAYLIHQYSGRKGKFFTVNTPSIPHHLFESEIFGHRRGSFTDAGEDKPGYVDEAAGGTLFFDEISEVPASFQAKLLRFIETKKYRVLGENSERAADVRIVAATNRNLFQAIDQKEFRADLYYRLSILEVEIPPLRERKEDIKIFVEENSRLLKNKKRSSGFWEEILNYSWPGNIRELLTVLTRVGIHAGETITGQDVLNHLNHKNHARLYPPNPSKIDRIWQEILAGGSFWETVRIPFLKRQLNCDEVKSIINRGLAENQQKYKKLIRQLNIPDEEYKKFLNFLMVHKIMQ